MRCTWQAEDHGPVCGEPADAFRVRFEGAHTRRWWFCRRHLAVVRRLRSDDEAARFWGVETMPIDSAQQRSAR